DTALHIAIEHHPELAVRLMQKKVPLNIPGKNKKTVEEMLCEKNPKPGIKLYLALKEMKDLKDLTTKFACFVNNVPSVNVNIHSSLPVNATTQIKLNVTISDSYGSQGAPAVA